MLANPVETESRGQLDSRGHLMPNSICNSRATRRVGGARALVFSIETRVDHARFFNLPREGECLDDRHD